MHSEPEFDFIIVGAGSAGCVLADRLSRNGDHRILVLEAGPLSPGMYSRIPAAVFKAYSNPKTGWGYRSEPEPNLHGRTIPIPRGRVAGGSSSINAMVHLRGHPEDYDGWEKGGAAGWNYAACLPYFKRSESSDARDDRYRGVDGPVAATRGSLENPIYDAFLSAVHERGYVVSDDLNGEQPEGFARLQATIRRGERCSTAAAYLKPALGRDNVTVVTNALAIRVALNGRRAFGVECTVEGETRVYRATREVIVSGGAVNSPQLLMLSGIGAAAHLKRHGIPVALDLPGVGQNLQDHADIVLEYETAAEVSLAWAAKPWWLAWVLARWFLLRTGPAASNIFEVGGIFKSGADSVRGDMQVHLAPFLFYDEPQGVRFDDGYMIHLALLRPESRGEIALSSGDPRAAPKIRFNFLSSENDLRFFREGIRRIREITSTGNLAKLTIRERAPGNATSDESLDEFVRRTVETEFHPCGTCKMGVDALAVVDPRLRVHGIAGLRVVDASVMPSIPSANLNAPTMMIAERAADMILSDHGAT